MNIKNKYMQKKKEIKEELLKYHEELQAIDTSNMSAILKKVNDINEIDIKKELIAEFLTDIDIHFTELKALKKSIEELLNDNEIIYINEFRNEERKKVLNFIDELIN